MPDGLPDSVPFPPIRELKLPTDEPDLDPSAADVDGSPPRPVKPPAPSEPAPTQGGAREAPAYSPLVRRLAEEFGVDLATLSGTGPLGRVTRSDVHRAAFPGEPLPEDAVLAMGSGNGTRPPIEATDPADLPDPASEQTPALEDPPPAEAQTPTPEDPPPGGAQAEVSTSVATVVAPTVRPQRFPGVRRVPLGPERARSAAKTLQSWTTVPQVTAFLDVEAEQLLRAQDRLSARIGFDLPLDALLIRLVLPALDDFPVMNAAVDGDELVLFDRRSIAFTCEAADGSTTVVVTDADRMSFDDLAHQVHDLSARAEAGRLGHGEQTEPTFTVSNIGAPGASAAIPILPLDTTAVVAYGQPRNVVRLVGDAPRETPIITLTGCFDHRVIDSHEAARFLARLASFLEDPITAFAH